MRARVSKKGQFWIGIPTEVPQWPGLRPMSAMTRAVNVKLVVACEA
jgi:hypothetical protein